MDKCKSILLKEYELCQRTTEKIEDTIWKTFSVIGIIAIGPLTVFLTIDPTIDSNENKIIFFIILGFIVVATTWIWWNMAGRWWDIQHTTFERMVDIESELKCIYQIHYIRFKDGILNVNDSHILSQKQKSKLQEDPEFKKKGVKKSLQYFPVLITFIWVVFILYLLSLKIKGGSVLSDNLIQGGSLLIGGIGIGIILTLFFSYSCQKKYHDQYMDLIKQLTKKNPPT